MTLPVPQSQKEILAELGLPVSVWASRNTRLPRWGAALERVRKRTGRAKLMVFSDSTSVGAFANAGTSYANNNMASCWPYLLAPLFNAAGFPTNIGSVFGDVTNTSNLTTLAAHDTRRSFGANWTAGAFYTIGGGVISNTTAGSQTLASFAPGVASEPFDTIIVTAIANAAYGKFSIAINGGASLQVVDLSTGGSIVKRVTQAVPLGNHRVDIFRSAPTGADGQINVVSIETLNSTKPGIDILNNGVGGATSLLQSGSSSYFMPLAVLPNYAPDLVLINLDINDWITGVTPGLYDLVTTTTHFAQVQKIITAAKATADVILMTGNPSLPASYSAATQNLILAPTRELAALNNAPLVDLNAEWGDYATALANGLMAPNNDAVHPGRPGYLDIANRVANVSGLFGLLNA